MSREIKFRAWDKETNRMFKPHSIECYISTEKEGQIAFLYDEDDSKVFEYELMQYTGLKDKNGKEIYEGDIIKHPSPGMGPLYIAEVRWDDFYCGFIVRGKNFGGSLGHSTDKHTEVIGNINENPDLIC